MKNMNYLDQILEFWLPTKSSRLIAGLSITLGVGAFLLPEFLSTLSIQIPGHLALLIRIVTPILLWLLGSLLVLHTVVQYSKTLKAQNQLPPPIPQAISKPVKLPKDQEDLLILLYKQGELLTFQIAQSLNMTEDIAKYHLKELTPKKFVREINLPGIGPPGQSSWFVTDKGKKYLIENKLIS
jgi:hypothetical protein